MIRMFLAFLAVAILVATYPGSAAAQQKFSPRAAAKPATGAVVNINSASATELEALPGIGAKTAERIIEYRQKNGPFKRVEDYREVGALTALPLIAIAIKCRLGC